LDNKVIDIIDALL